MSILCLPDELIYLIIELGKLDVVDGLALSETCKGLRAVSDCSSYWIPIARNMAVRNRPLPLPPGFAVTSLPPHALRRILCQHHHSTENLAAPEPKLRRSQILPLPKVHEESPVAHCSFVHGCARFLIAYQNGLIQLWDIAHHVQSKPPDSVGCEIVLEAGSRPTGVGRLLAEYDTTLQPCSLNIETSEGSGDFIVAIASQLISVQRAALCVLSFRETSEEDTLSCREIFRTELGIGSDRPRAALYGRLAGLFFEIDFKLAMAIFDYATGHGKIIATTSSCHHDRITAGLYIAKEEDVVICTSSGEILEVEIFLDVGTMLVAPQDTQFTPIILPPNATMKIPYHEHSQVQDTDEWRILCARNITDTTQVPLITLSETEEGLDVMTFEWLDVEEIVQAAKSGRTISESRSRNIFNFSYPIAGTSRTSKAWGIGSKGCHEVWIDHSGPEDGRVLNVLPLHKDGSDLSRPLRLPIDIDYISDILAFSDEAAVVAVLTEACETGCCRPSDLFCYVDRVTFNGIDGTEAEDFIANIIQIAYSKGKQDDDKWIIDFVATCLTGDAIRWRATLDSRTRADWSLFQKAFFARFQPHFRGIDGLECERFVNRVRQHALEQGKQRDNAWIADSVSASFDGDALRWYATLDGEVTRDWRLLQRELFIKYPPPEKRTADGTPSRLIPVAAAAPASSVAMVASIPTPLPTRRQGRIKLHITGLPNTEYVSKSFLSSTQGNCVSTRSASDALVVRFIVSNGAPVTLEIVDPMGLSGWQWLGVHQRSVSPVFNSTSRDFAYLVQGKTDASGIAESSWESATEVLSEPWLIAQDGTITATWADNRGNAHILTPKVTIFTKIIALAGSKSGLDRTSGWSPARFVFEDV